MIGAVDIAIVVAGWVVENIVFRDFEAHVPLWRRFAKLLVLLAVLITTGVLEGRPTRL